MHEVVITGIGVISVLGNTTDDVSKALYEGRSGIAVDPERVKLGFESPLTGFIRDFDPRKFLSRKQLKPMSEHAAWAYAATVEALGIAGLEPHDLHNEENGLIFGCDSSCMGSVEQTNLLLERGDTGLIGSGAIFKSMTSNVTINLNALLKTQGAAWSVSGACASGGHAIGQGFSLIAMGQQERVICGGAQEINWQSMCSFDGLGAFANDREDPTRASRPFDRDRSGLVPSGGAASVILERRDLAEKRGAAILGTVRGYGFSSDGWHISEPSPTGLFRSGRKALKSAGMSPADLDYVCAHATATPVGDASEAGNLKELLGSHSPVISSTKSMTGHELWTTGASQVVYCALMARDGFIAPNINLDNLDPAAEGLNITPVTVERAPRNVLCNSAGFGGTNSSLVLSF